MSNYRYEFWCGVGYSRNACRSEEVDLVDDFGYDESMLDGLSDVDLEDLVNREADEWAGQFVEIWTERQ